MKFIFIEIEIEEEEKYIKIMLENLKSPISKANEALCRYEIKQAKMKLAKLKSIRQKEIILVAP